MKYNPYTYRHLSLILLIITLFCSHFTASAYEPIQITGANGKEMEFAGVKEAKPEGIVLLMKEGGKPMLVLWKSLDLEALKNHQTVYTAYQKATSTNKIIPIGLGYYEDMVSEEAFLKNLKQILSKKHAFKVPKLSDFFEHKDDDTSYLSTSYGEDKNAAKRSKRFVKDYTDLIEEFFKVKNPQLLTNTTTWTYDNKDPFVIVKEATLKGPASIKLSTLEVINFFADKSTRSQPRCSKYFSAYPDGVRALIWVLDDQIALLESGRLIAEPPQQANYKYLLKAVRGHFEKMLDTNTLNTSIQRDFSNFMREFGNQE